MSDLRTIKIDGVEHELPADLTLLQACEMAGKEIPRFCYHERLSIAGNCRMCLIEVKGGPPKPVASCAQNVRDLRPGPEGQPPEIFTSSPMVKKAREGVMEFLLINHPLDCPICDQGGECDLQDQAIAYGRDGSRYEENKRAVEDKHMGPLIKTIMTRCIQCTRCVRFATEVAGVDDLGMLNRGEDAEITTYLEKSLDSELSGNVIDLCPVGALTSKPYAFNARPWELRKTETVDVMDAQGAPIRVDSRGREVLRILPRINDAINEEWISDKTRFVWDGLRRQRLDRPYIRRNGKLAPASWDEALALVADKLQATPAEKIGAVAGDLCDAESMFALKGLMEGLGVANLDCRQDGSQIGLDANGKALPRATYLFNSTIAGAEEADVLLLIGANPRREAPVLNARIRKNWLRNFDLRVGLIGEAAPLTYGYEHLGHDAAALKAIADGGHEFAAALKSAARPMLILGAAALARPDGLAVLAAATKIARDCGLVRKGESEGASWNGFNVLHTAASRVAGLDLGFLPGANGRDTTDILDGAEAGEIELVYLLGADELDMRKLDKAFVIYQGSHGDAGAQAADVILPGAAYTEKPGVYVNFEGRAQLGFRAIFPPGEAREDWAVIRALSGRMDKALPYDSHDALRRAMFEAAPALGSIDHVAPSFEIADLEAVGEGGAMTDAPFRPAIDDFYLTNPIARASAVLAECSRQFARREEALAAAE